MEYRYWAFMESHPATPMDVLTWAWTDRVLPPQQLPLPPPFTQNECQELSGLLRSFGETAQTESGIQSIVVTRIVARILLPHWRQYHFRPHKPLPLERTGNHHLRNFPRPPGFMRRVADVLLSCLLLGVPYLFYTRGGYHRGDAEAGAASARSLLPILLIGACTCLLAAVLLSASVTFLSLPGLDSIARAVVLAVVLLAAGAMASGLVALFRYKAELVDAAAPMNTVMVGGEGMMIISTRSVVMSLPLVLLIYAVLGFVAAVVLYSFLGVNASAVRFEDYTRWAVLGVLGGLAGVLTMSVVLLR
ncbi:hypothetical protein K438DRAFT_1902762 [Mycena galopus ATCC 62051]|nr:hypothetical protein K438DRAFT_1902762 [Mycena galopus ATCC 62051]